MRRLTLAGPAFKKAPDDSGEMEHGPVQREGSINAEQLSELELGLTVLWNSVRRWMNQRSKASLIAGLSDLDTFLLHLLVYRDRQMRAADLAFALSIDDMHLVSYSLKKLVRLEAVETARLGKEIAYAATDKGRQHYAEFLEDRERYLEPAMKYFNAGEFDVEGLKDLFRAMSGVYEQAARAAASAKGD
jgi:predicted MarR family transcription regulator